MSADTINHLETGLSRVALQYQESPKFLEWLRALLAYSEEIEALFQKMALQVDIDRGFNARLQLAPVDEAAIASEAAGIRAQFDLASAQRARGMAIDWADDERGKGLVIDNPNAPPKVRNITPAQADEQARAGALVIVDVRPADERAQASIAIDHRSFDDGVEEIESLPKDTPLAFLCHRGGRSAQAAEHFRALGFKNVSNIAGGIDAWSQVDPAVPRY